MINQIPNLGTRKIITKKNSSPELLQSDQSLDSPKSFRVTLYGPVETGHITGSFDEVTTWRIWPFNAHLGVSENREYPQIIHFNRVFNIIKHPFWGTPIFGNTHLDLCGKTDLPTCQMCLPQELPVDLRKSWFCVVLGGVYPPRNYCWDCWWFRNHALKFEVEVVYPVIYRVLSYMPDHARWWSPDGYTMHRSFLTNQAVLEVDKVVWIALRWFIIPDGTPYQL